MKLSELHAVAMFTAFALLSACAQQPQPSVAPSPNAGPLESASILAWSKPAAGSVVRSPVNDLVLHFTPSARLVQVTVTGPDGTMPMMVEAVGEVAQYALPLSGLGPGKYSADRKASVGGVDHRGSFGFEVR